eukprot:jgi/Mesen1/9408/ME000614S08673
MSQPVSSQSEVEEEPRINFEVELNLPSRLQTAVPSFRHLSYSCQPTVTGLTASDALQGLKRVGGSSTGSYSFCHVSTSGMAAPSARAGSTIGRRLPRDKRAGGRDWAVGAAGKKRFPGTRGRGGGKVVVKSPSGGGGGGVRGFKPSIVRGGEQSTGEKAQQPEGAAGSEGGAVAVGEKEAGMQSSPGAEAGVAQVAGGAEAVAEEAEEEEEDEEEGLEVEEETEAEVDGSAEASANGAAAKVAQAADLEEAAADDVPADNVAATVDSPDDEDERDRNEQLAAERLLATQLEAEKDARRAAGAQLAKKERQEELLRQLAAEQRAARLPKLQLVHEYSNSKMFSYPEEPRAGERVEIFFHRSISTLGTKSAPLFMMGAFNSWRWKNFRLPLSRSADLAGGDWWVCEMVVPPEAYRVDFVFVSEDGDTYENNEGNDFFLAVSGGFTESQFDDMLADERRKEAERQAAVEAERERVAAEEKRLADIAAAKAALKKRAANLAAEQRAASAASYSKAVASLQNVWYTEPAEMTPADRCIWEQPLDVQTWLHCGHNNWANGVELVEPLELATSEDGDWWSIQLTVPEDAFMLNWVLADGPPKKATVYDNNSMQDYAATVGGPEREAAYFADVEARLVKQLEQERAEAEKKAVLIAQERTRRKAAMRERTRREFLQSQAHVIFTEPVDVRAGEDVTVMYNPANTVLNGYPEVWMRGSFNRWTHKSGCFMPLKMAPAPNGTHLQATVPVPKDAYMVDLVFSEKGGAEGGLYDNKGGLDYHIPVTGGTAQAPPLHIVHIALEMAPIAKVGGLGDVVTSLSRAVQELGHTVDVILPKYDCLKYNLIHNLVERPSFSWGGTEIKVWHGIVEGVSTIFLEPANGFFWVGCIYGRKDDGARFHFFCQAALEYLVQSHTQPNIIHAHDWSSAPAVWMFAESYKQYGLARTRTVFTIHNLEFGAAQIGRAMAAADKCTTVSPTYAREVAGNGAIAPHLAKFHGIINGIDLDIWDPLGDPYIPMPYTSAEVREGKAAARKELQARLGLQRVDDRPLIGCISRLTAQKGMHLIKHAVVLLGSAPDPRHQNEFQGLANQLANSHGNSARFYLSYDEPLSHLVVLLGSAPDPRHQNEFQGLANQLANSHGNSARFYLSYDEPLSHLIYAACDMILVPSIFEPCGLTQLTALRYGCIPVVRKTGGLNDTVLDVENDRERARALGIEPNGYNFEGADAAGMDYALNRAIDSYYNNMEGWRALQGRVMEQDWSWNKPALDYLELYYGALK